MAAYQSGVAMEARVSRRACAISMESGWRRCSGHMAGFRQGVA
jgi:hypothetical protein